MVCVAGCLSLSSVFGILRAYDLDILSADTRLWSRTKPVAPDSKLSKLTVCEHPWFWPCSIKDKRQ